MSGGRVPIFDLPELDRPLESALPAGWLGLIEDDGGGVGHLLAKQAAHAGAASVPVYYYATHETAAEVTRAFDALGWESSGVNVIDLEQELWSDLLHRELAVARARAKGLTLAEAQVEVGGAAPRRAPPAVGGRLVTDIAPLDGPFRYVLDSIDPLLDELGAAGAERFARQIRERAAAVGGSALVVVRPEVPELRTLALLELVADFVLASELEEQESVIAPKIIVRKVRNHPELARIYRASVGEKGIEVVPL